jgi:D-alanine-D-alanine ligase-like ATP-grasp enzyme
LLKGDGVNCDLKDIIESSIKELIKDTLKSVDGGRLNPQNRKFCFEIFGYDFIIDSELNPWLIEVNTNPCLEESSALLKTLIPRMLDDALKLTLDVIYPPKK